MPAGHQLALVALSKASRSTREMLVVFAGWFKALGSWYPNSRRRGDRRRRNRPLLLEEGVCVHRGVGGLYGRQGKCAQHFVGGRVGSALVVGAEVRHANCTRLVEFGGGVVVEEFAGVDHGSQLTQRDAVLEHQPPYPHARVAVVGGQGLPVGGFCRARLAR